MVASPWESRTCGRIWPGMRGSPRPPRPRRGGVVRLPRFPKPRSVQQLRPVRGPNRPARPTVSRPWHAGFLARPARRSRYWPRRQPPRTGPDRRQPASRSRHPISCPQNADLAGQFAERGRTCRPRAIPDTPVWWKPRWVEGISRPEHTAGCPGMSAAKARFLRLWATASLWPRHPHSGFEMSSSTTTLG